MQVFLEIFEKLVKVCAIQTIYKNPTYFCMHGHF